MFYNENEYYDPSNIFHTANTITTNGCDVKYLKRNSYFNLLLYLMHTHVMIHQISMNKNVRNNIWNKKYKFEKERVRWRGAGEEGNISP